MHLGLDVDIHKLEAEKLRKWKNKAEEDLDSLKTNYRKLRLSIKTVGLGKTSEQWRQEIKEEKTKANQWEKKFQGTQARESALEKSLLECQNEEARLKARVADLENQIRDRDYIMGEVVTQVWEVADHLQTLVVQADILSLKYKLKSSQGRELAWLLRRVKALSIKAKPYITSLRHKKEDKSNGSKVRKVGPNAKRNAR
ncbi:hypothetical protein Goshw_022876 [Gossypium schwendimanii]|uniref:Uncharacterized protein n=1 Tax=Gossypium schwendimanii TaxID=34291 RepID=A0A7J9N6P4_GOSSC|nr:hypothetical protein [Gossypium schwendimanii]